MRWVVIKCGSVLRPESRLLGAEFFMRLVGQASFTLFIAAVYKLTGRAADIGIVGIATALPALGVMLWVTRGGAQFSPGRMVRIASLARIFAFLVAAIFSNSEVALYIAAALQSLCHQVADTGKMALDADTVLSERRLRFNSTKAMVRSISIIFGPPLGGVLVAGFGEISSYLLMGIIGCMPLLLLRGLVSSPTPIHHKEASEGGSLLSTLRYLARLPRTASIVAVYCIVAVILEVQAPLIFPFVKEVYGAGGDFAGFLLGLAGFGGIAGAFAVRRMASSLTDKVLAVVLLGDGLCFLAFTQIHNQVAASLLFTVLGAVGAVTMIAVETAVQNDVPSRFRPLIYAVMQFAAGAGGATLGILAAVAADTWGAKTILAVAATAEAVVAAVLLSGVLVVVFTRLSQARSGLEAQ